MITQNIVDYLRENKNKFPREVLEKKLIEKGYPGDQIKEGIRIIYEEISVPPTPPETVRETSFWDFRSIKIYTSFSEKLLDFLFGFFALIIIDLGIYFLLKASSLFFFYSLGSFWILPLGIFIAQIFGIFYFWKRRHYLARGLLFCLLLPLILTLVGLFLLFLIFR